KSQLAGGRIDETTHCPMEFRLIEKKGIVPTICLYLNKGDGSSGCIQRVDDHPALPRGEEPVAGEGNYAEACLAVLESVGQTSVMLRRQIEIIHGAGEIEIGIGVETIDEGEPLMAQVALDLEVGIKAERPAVSILQVAAKLAVKRRFRKIGDVRTHARNSQAFARMASLLDIGAATPIRVCHDRLTANLVEGNILCGMPSAGGDGNGEADAFGKASCPF